MNRPIVLFCLVLIAVALVAQTGVVPAYHPGPPPSGTSLPPILSREQLSGPDFQEAYQQHAYELAARIPAVLYQQPCYCYCDRMGHTSLRSCYQSTHAAMCGVCLRELYYAYQMHKEGKSASQIRAGMVRGEWKQIDLETAAKIK